MIPSFLLCTGDVGFPFANILATLRKVCREVGSRRIAQTRLSVTKIAATTKWQAKELPANLAEMRAATIHAAAVSKRLEVLRSIPARMKN